MGHSGLIEVEERVAAAASDAGRIDPITIVVVAKYASDLELEQVITEGARHIGESRSDSLRSRAARFGGVSWHFVGRLQGNKVKAVREQTALLHSMDRARLAGYWADGDGQTPPVLIQVNLANEPQKAGAAPAQVQPLIETCVAAGIEVRGLMTVPPQPKTPSDSRRWFSELREIRDRVLSDHPGVRDLSMGMSGDFSIAVAEGATILRVGRAIFEPFRKGG
jgi:PLP dependent protein